MWRRALLAITITLIGYPALGKEPMDCSIGQIEKTFGGTRWLVHGCSDGKSVVVVSAPGNPAMPFYFFVYPEGEGYRLYGEGNGDRAATKPAYDELSASLSEAFVTALHAETVVSAKNSGAGDGT